MKFASQNLMEDSANGADPQSEFSNSSATKFLSASQIEDVRRIRSCRNVWVATVFLGLVCAVFALAPALKAQQFNGNWALDLHKTRGVPRMIESYTLQVQETTKMIRVRTQIKRSRGNRPQFNGGGGPYGSAGGYPGGGYPRGGPPRGGRRKGMAFSMTVPDGKYSLDGSEKTVELHNRFGGEARVLASVTPNGKGVMFTISRHLEFGDRRVNIESAEKWRLTHGGQVLKIKRTVTTRRGESTVVLRFERYNP